MENGKSGHVGTMIINLTRRDEPANSVERATRIISGGERETEDGLLSGARSLDKHYSRRRIIVRMRAMHLK